MTAAVSVQDLGKRYRLYHERNQSLKGTILQRRRSRFEDFWALRNVSFEVPHGATFGLIGENGSGKSTLLKCLARILLPDEGTVRTDGKVAALLELGSGFHPELTGRENVYLNGSILGLSTRELDRRFDEIVDFAGIEHFIDQPVKNYSSGMYVRLGFSVAINVDPEILLLDEVLAVGDEAFQRKCEQRFTEFRESGRTVVLVSHAMGAMRSLCDTVAWLDKGRLQTIGDPGEQVDSYVADSMAARTEPSGSGTRWGSGALLVEQVELLDAAGVARTSFTTGAEVTMRLHWRADRRVVQPVFGYAIETLDGTYLWAHNSRDGQAVPDALEGRGYIDLVIPALMLQPGVFDLSASAVDHSLAIVFDYRRHLLRFDVLPTTPRESGGFMALGGRWAAAVALPAGQASAAGTSR